jgi:hypothetical protein
MSRIFISYRRDDSAGHARLLYDRLSEDIGRDQVFMDIGIAPSEHFPALIEQALARCDVLLAIIGPNWAGVRDKTGRRRLHDPEDYVRLEIATALRRRDVAVLPVLVHGARMPDKRDLPDDLQALAGVQAYELLDGRHWAQDLEFLSGAVRREIGAATALPALVFALVAVGLLLWPAYKAGLAVQGWPAPPDKDGPLALVRLGAVHAASWAIFVAAAAAGAAGAARGARAIPGAAVVGALAGVLAGLAGGALDQALRAQGNERLGLVAGFAVTGALAALGRLPGRPAARAIVGAALGGALGGLLAYGHRGFFPVALPALLAVAGAGLAGLAPHALAYSRRLAAPQRRPVRAAPAAPDHPGPVVSRARR